MAYYLPTEIPVFALGVRPLDGPEAIVVENTDCGGRFKYNPERKYVPLKNKKGIVTYKTLKEAEKSLQKSRIKFKKGELDFQIFNLRLLIEKGQIGIDEIDNRLKMDFYSL